MANLKATPKNFEQALLVLGLRDSIRLGNNTYLEVTAKDRDLVTEISVRLHSTRIVRFHQDGSVTLHTGGYYTATTKERINQFITGCVWQKDYRWFYNPPIRRDEFNNVIPESVPTKPFAEGIEVGR
jgi:hypothetical protein